MSDYTNALAKFLQSEKNAFAEPQRMLWPFRKDPYTGDMGLGHSMVTESLVNGLQFPAKAMSGKVPMFSEYEDGKVHWSPEWMQGANDTSGLAMTGAIGLPKPQNALGSGGGGRVTAQGTLPIPDRQAGSLLPSPQQLPQTADDLVRQMPAASQSQLGQGRHTNLQSDPLIAQTLTRKDPIDFGDELFFRGADATHNNFSPHFNANYPEAVFATSSPRNAADYAFSHAGADGAPAVYPIQARTENRKIYDAFGRRFDEVDIDEMAIEASRDGYRSLLVKNVVDPGGDNEILADTLVALKRGTFFDRNGNLLYSNPREGAAAAQMTNVGQQDEDPMVRLLKQYGLF